MRWVWTPPMLAALLSSSLAAAQVPEKRCGAADVAPARGATIPANAPAVGVDPRWSEASVRNLALVDGADAGVTTTARAGAGSEQLLVPTAPLAVGGAYALRYDVGCGPDGGFGGSVGSADFLGAQTTPFSAGAAAPLPTKLGALTLDVTRGRVGPSFDASTQARAVLRLAIADEMKPYIPLARLTVLVDGARWATGSYGGALAKLGDDKRNVDELFATCVPGTPAPDSDPGVKLGKATVTVQAHIAGAPADPPPITANVEIACDPAATPTDAGADGSVPTAIVTPAACTCDVVGGHGPGRASWAVAGMIGLAVALARRRERVRPTRASKRG